MISMSGLMPRSCPTASSSRVEIAERSVATGMPLASRGVLQRRLGADDLADRAGVRRQALDLTAAQRRERLAEVDDRLRSPDRAARERERDPDDRPDDEAADREPPAQLQALPRGGEVDLLLFESRGGASLMRRATLAAAQRH